MSGPVEVPWQRLDPRMIWVDALRSAVSLLPAVLAFPVLGVEPRLQTVGPVLFIAVVGVTGAVSDVLRWIKTRYRVTDEHVERRTGLLVRKYRSVRRDRIRSVDTTAKLRHRLAGLRLVTIGAGQQRSAGKALALDAVSREVAAALRRDLLPGAAGSPPAQTGTAGEVAGAAPAGAPAEQELARVRWSWIFYNMFSIWAYVAGVGILWGGLWLASGFGLDPVGYLADRLDWSRLGWPGWVLLGLVTVGLFGAAVLAVSFVTENWSFRLTRVTGPDGTVLRTTQGLFKTREVNRDDRRLRGVEISEPVLWRWMGMADTNIITTGLAIWSLTPATTVVPRGPVSVARPVAAAVLGEQPSPLAAPLARHPRAALRRRLWWAVLVTAGVVGLLAWLAATTAVPGWAPLAGLSLLPVALAAAVVAYRALGHALAGSAGAAGEAAGHRYLVVRSGLVSRSTAALQSRAVTGWHVRQSLLQRRLGLASVGATTAAGYGYYQAVDLAAGDAAGFAEQAVPGLLTPFLARPEGRQR